MKIVIDIPEDAYKVPQSNERTDWLNKSEYEFFKENPEAHAFVTSNETQN